MTLLADVNDPGSQEYLVSNWEPAHCLVVEPARSLAISGAEIATFQLWLLPACLSASGEGWAGPQLATSPLVFAKSFVL